MAIRDESRVQRPEHTFTFRYVHNLPCFSLRNSSSLRIIHIFLCTRLFNYHTKFHRISYGLSLIIILKYVCVYVCMYVFYVDAILLMFNEKRP